MSKRKQHHPKYEATQQAQTVINHWLRQYNQTRPHQALNMRSQVSETIIEKAQISSPEAGGYERLHAAIAKGTPEVRRSQSIAV